jgi:hypothetical protein
VNVVVRCDTGLGTTYERWAMNRFLSGLQAETGIRTIFEGPGDGMTGIAGINSLILGLQEVEVTVLLPDLNKASFAQEVWGCHAPRAEIKIDHDWDGISLPYGDEQFDLVWNFNVMTLHNDPIGLLAELKRVSRKYVLICTPNRHNYSFWLHRLHHIVAKQPWDHGRIDWMEPAPWKRMFAQVGLQTEKIYWLDCPWWPDIVNPGEMLTDFFPILKRFHRSGGLSNRIRWSYDDLPYYQPTVYSETHERMARLGFFENTRHQWLKRRFAHHVGILASKG